MVQICWCPFGLTGQFPASNGSCPRSREVSHLIRRACSEQGSRRRESGREQGGVEGAHALMSSSSAIGRGLDNRHVESVWTEARHANALKCLYPAQNPACSLCSNVSILHKILHVVFVLHMLGTPLHANESSRLLQALKEAKDSARFSAALSNNGD
eukprot:3352280-Rhodomonas_salina.3